ncbi:phosphotransferase enzyme family protein [Paludisphaera soli]|uniref:phosphotransferase enzyme family protein n=1 Tax=Paludisphaera soli TaxID=2712865 RepID=UPI0013EB3451|nr:phosphotransferase [Paludisphaera soli]
MTSEELRTVVDRYPAAERPLAPPVSLGGAGGLSGSRLWRYTSRSGDRLVRAWPSAIGVERVSRIHAWLRRLADLPFVPQPIATRAGDTIVRLHDRSWEVAPWLRGTSASIERAHVDRVRAVFEALAKVHVRLAGSDARRGPSPGLSARCDEVAALRRSGFDEIERSLDLKADDPLAGSATTWLRSARRAAPDVLAAASPVVERAVWLQPCLRDARPGHFLFDQGRLSGLVDFGAMDVESVSADLARLAGEWFGPDDLSLRSEGLEAYGRIRPLESAEVEAAQAFETLADLLIGERWVRWRFLEGRRFDDRVYLDGIGRGLARLGRLEVGRRSEP